MPNPILESQPMHDPSSSLLMMPIRARVRAPPKLPLSNSATTLNPSTLQYVCKEPREPIYAIHASRPSEVFAVLSISNQRMQRVRLPVDDSKAYFLADVHTETNFSRKAIWSLLRQTQSFLRQC